MMRRLLMAAALFAAAAPAEATEVALQPGETLLEVQAEGQARFRPDVAYVGMGVVSTGTTAREATDANARVMAKVIAAVREAGVDPRYLRTQQISVEPRFARSGPADYQGQAEITGFVARNSVAVTLTKLDSAPDVITAGFAAGANSMEGPNLSSENLSAGLAAARADALVKARAQADAYASGLGMKIARILRVSERGAAGTSDLFLAANASRAVSRVPLETGEMQRRALIWIDYALVPK